MASLAAHRRALLVLACASCCLTGSASAVHAAKSAAHRLPVAARAHARVALSLKQAANNASGRRVPLQALLRAASGETRRRQPLTTPTPTAGSVGPMLRLERLRQALGRALLLPLGAWLCAALVHSGVALASGGMAVSAGPRIAMGRQELIVRTALWSLLFSLAAVLAGAETAITTLWPWKVKQLAAEDEIFESLQEDVTKVLSTVLVGVTFCTVYGTALATDIAIQLFGQIGVGYATVALTLMTLFFGEIAPKTLAVAKAEAVARATLPLIRFMSIVFYPLGRLISLGTQALLHLLGVGENGDETTVTEPELRMMLMGAKQSGAVELYEQDMIEGVLDLDQSTVEQIMRPRVDVVGIDSRASLSGLLDLSRETKYSRIPVYNGTIDEIIGVVYTRDLIEFAALPPEDLERLKVSSIMEDTAFVPESMSAMNALKLMRRQRLHMMVVVDEYGGTSGIVTLEDILETLVGKIYDEDDDDEVQEEVQSIVRNKDGSWSIDGMAELEAAGNRLALELPDETRAEISTISGFLCQQAGQIPEKGDVLIVGHIRFEVLEADERRVLSVAARDVADAPGSDPSDSRFEPRSPSMPSTN